ncbi:hypothetical protein AVEN_38377-1 [Araneus ventricosus]|uniref:Uncharacterized protein n=1 Tax=Araneus ventricosus TaxID=182803 RepID=A0A4Y2M6X7_ARAVE|nr:hypothetical protein AVEN_38377-1 [Araneus ventricosus]
MQNLGCLGEAPDSPLQLSQQSLSFARSLGIVMLRMTPSLNMPGHLCWMASRWPGDYFFLPKLEEHLYGTRFSSNSDAKTGDENWLNEQGRYF